MTADNPHGFSAAALATIRAITDPQERSRVESELLNRRTRRDAKLADTEYYEKRLEHKRGNRRQNKTNAGYVAEDAIVFNHVF